MSNFFESQMLKQKHFSSFFSSKALICFLEYMRIDQMWDDSDVRMSVFEVTESANDNSGSTMMVQGNVVR